MLAARELLEDVDERLEEPFDRLVVKTASVEEEPHVERSSVRDEHVQRRGGLLVHHDGRVVKACPVGLSQRNQEPLVVERHLALEQRVPPRYAALSLDLGERRILVGRLSHVLFL